MSKNGGGLVQEIRRRSWKMVLYECDPEKNESCRRKDKDCFQLTGNGKCRMTALPEFAVEEGGRPKVSRILRFEGGRIRSMRKETRK